MCTKCGIGNLPKGVVLIKDPLLYYELQSYSYCPCPDGIKLKNKRKMDKLLLSRSMDLGNVKSPNYELTSV